VRASQHLLYIGGEDHALRIPFMQALAARGFRVTAAGTGDAAPFGLAGIDYRRFDFDRFINPLADWRTIRRVAKILADVRADLVHSFDTKPNLFVPFAARAGRVGLVVRTINGLGWIYSSRSPLASALAPAYRTLHRAASRSTALTVFQNRDDKMFFERHRLVERGAARLIPGSGVDIARFEQAAANGPPPSVLRERLGLGASAIVMTVTRLTREKGIRTLLEAAALVNAARPDVQFLLVGPRQSEGRFAVTQEEIDRHSPYVTALGPRSDIPSLLALADVFAFPTEYREGVPRALLEAALAGVPIVTTRMPGCSDVVRDGWSGLLVPPRAPRILAEGIITLLGERQRARTMARNAAALVRREFSLDITVARYAAAYEELIGHRACPAACAADGAQVSDAGERSQSSLGALQ
jgi:glycosyltransferase involved in cell wall biosynthesis